MSARWVPLAEVTRPHGVWGEVRLKLYNSDSELLLSRPDVLVRRPGAEATMQFESIRGADAGFLLAKFRGVDGRDAAELLRGAAVCVDRADFPPVDEGEFYVCDVIGARLVGPSGEIGAVEDFVSYPSADVLIITLRNGSAKERVELPLLDDFIEVVDTAAGEVRLTSAGLDWLRGVAAGKSGHAG